MLHKKRVRPISRAAAIELNPQLSLWPTMFHDGDGGK
jgi:hypothetical protein